MASTELSLPGTGIWEQPRAGRGMRQEGMWKPPVAQICKPLVQPALLGLEQRCGDSGQGDRVPVGLLAVMRKLWEGSCPQMAAPGLGSGTSRSDCGVVPTL